MAQRLGQLSAAHASDSTSAQQHDPSVSGQDTGPLTVCDAWMRSKAGLISTEHIQIGFVDM